MTSKKEEDKSLEKFIRTLNTKHQTLEHLKTQPNPPYSAYIQLVKYLHSTMKLSILYLLSTITAASAAVLSLTPDNFESATSGKTVFIKFFAPWVCLIKHFPIILLCPSDSHLF